MDTREKIIEESGRLFTEHGIKKITMDIIARSLGISKRTIYETFKDKNDLLYNFLTIASLRHKKRSFVIMSNAANVIEALFQLGEFNRKELENVNPAFFEDMKKYHPDVFRKVMGNGEIQDHEATYTLLKRGVNEGIFLKEIDLEIANLFIHHMMEFFHKIEKGPSDHLKIWRTVHLPYLRGICTEKGNKIVNSFLDKMKT
jgi:AcrR family transcriptional regulator